MESEAREPLPKENETRAGYLRRTKILAKNMSVARFGDLYSQTFPVDLTRGIDNSLREIQTETTYEGPADQMDTVEEESAGPSKRPSTSQEAAPKPQRMPRTTDIGPIEPMITPLDESFGNPSENIDPLSVTLPTAPPEFQVTTPANPTNGYVKLNALCDNRPILTDNKTMPVIIQNNYLADATSARIWFDTGNLPTRQKTFLRYMNVLAVILKDSLLEEIAQTNAELNQQESYVGLEYVLEDVTADLDIYVVLWHALNRIRQGRNPANKEEEILYSLADPVSIDRLSQEADRLNRYKTLRNPSTKMICFQMTYRFGNTTPKYIPVCKYVDINALANELVVLGNTKDWFEGKRVRAWMSAKAKDLGIIGMNAVKLQAANFAAKRMHGGKVVTQAEKVLVDRGNTKNGQTTRRMRAHYSNVFGPADGVTLAITQTHELDNAISALDDQNTTQRRPKKRLAKEKDNASRVDANNTKYLNDNIRQARTNLNNTKERVARSFTSQLQKDIFEVIVEETTWESATEKTNYIDLLRKSCLVGKFKPYLRSKIIIPLEIFRLSPELESDEDISREINNYGPRSMLWHEHRIFEYYFDVAFNMVGFIKYITGRESWTVRSNRSAVKFNIFTPFNPEINTPEINRGYKSNNPIPILKILFKRVTKTDGMDQSTDKEYVTQQTYKAAIILNDKVKALSYGDATDKKEKFDALMDAVKVEDDLMKAGTLSVMKLDMYQVWGDQVFGEQIQQTEVLRFAESGNPMDL